MTSSGAMAGMLVGAVTVFAWKEVVPADTDWFKVYEMIPGFAFGSLAIIVVSLLSSKPEQNVLDTFDKQRRPIRKQNDRLSPFLSTNCDHKIYQTG